MHVVGNIVVIKRYLNYYIKTVSLQPLAIRRLANMVVFEIKFSNLAVMKRYINCHRMRVSDNGAINLLANMVFFEIKFSDIAVLKIYIICYTMIGT